MLTANGYQQAKIVLPSSIFNQIYKDDLKDDSDEEPPADTKTLTPYQFGRSIMNERITVKFVERIDLQKEIRKLQSC